MNADRIEGTKRSAEKSADRIGDRLLREHPLERVMLITHVMALTELVIAEAGLSRSEWAAVIKELQASLDDFNAFTNQS